MRFCPGIYSLLILVLLPLIILNPSSLKAEADINSALVQEKTPNEVVMYQENLGSATNDLVGSESDNLTQPVANDFVEDSVINEVAVPEEISFESEEDSEPELASKTAQPEKLYEKADALEPSLMVRGAPLEEVCETAKKEKLKGRIIPEKHPINRRKSLFRWVLETEEGKRIPLKSNLSLLTLVRKESILDGQSMLTGYYVQSGMNKDLRYFVVENAVPAGDSEKKSADEEKAAGPKKKQK